ncbi:uncharacterized protein LOC126369106 [Pectinophora gossypiella]|uniref:uncharacterized protein LOC126369106 n=1 Tax=Pectinophora gossypiella TaxID=13191 RepID=UPI00214EBCA2|nr:uncharacterized protein LOC126369106 [Pectinophora gossypiella]
MDGAVGEELVKLQFYVYSAYVERRMMYAVRIIAATNTYTPDKVWCHLWLPNGRTVTIEASIQVIKDHENLEYTAAFVLCPLRYSGVSADETVGAIVAVIASKAPDEPTTNLLIVQDTAPKTNISGNLHVCVKPFYRYSRTEWTLEWLEMNRLLGVSHFYLYNDSISDRFGCLLKYYEDKGVVTLRQWQLPLKSDVDIKGNGMVAAYNDCLYRSMSKADWLLIIDADEIVLPRYEKTVPQLVRSLTDEFVTKKAVAFNFTNAYFYVFWEDDPEAPSPLMTSRKTQRLKTNEVDEKNDNTRNKYVFQPLEVVELGRNNIWEKLHNSIAVEVSVKRAVVHHYRIF